MKRRLLGLPGAGRLVLFLCDLCPARTVRFLRPSIGAVPAGWQATPLPAPDPPANVMEHRTGESPAARRALHECPRCSRGWQRAGRTMRAERNDGFARGSVRREPGGRERTEGEEGP